MIEVNTLQPNEVGVDFAGTDVSMGVYAEQIPITSLVTGGVGIICTYQPISVVGEIMLYNGTDPQIQSRLLRQQVQGQREIKLTEGSVGEICWVQYRF